MQKIQTFLWFDGQAEEAANQYLSIFKNSKLLSTMPGPGGKPMGLTVELDGWQFITFNGGPTYHPTPSISFTVSCDTVEEIDRAWAALSDGGKPMMELNKYPWSERYGWIEDRFGVSWQLTLAKEHRPIAPTLLYSRSQQGKAEEAMNFYLTQFPNSSIQFIARYEEGEPGPLGQIKYGSFSINGQSFNAMDSGRPMDNPFTPGISMFINVETQEEVDWLWDGLASNGGRHDRCGWLQDKYGVSWQVVPTVLGKVLGGPDRKKAGNAMQAMMKMTKLDIAELQRAYDEG